MRLFGFRVPYTRKFDHRLVRLGRLPSPHDPRTLRFAKYITKELPPAPATCDYGTNVKQWFQLLNNTLGDCTIAAVLHAIMVWRSQNGVPYVPADSTALRLYESWCGYVSGQPSTDRGGIEIEILRNWRKTAVDGCQLVGFAAVDPTNWEDVKLALWLAGVLYMGIDLPTTAQNEAFWSDLSGTPGSWGGHATAAMAYKDVGLPGTIMRLLRGAVGAQAQSLTCVTWGTTQGMSPEWLAKYCVELWVPITTDWFKDGKAPNGFDLATLQADVAAITSQPN